MVNLWTIPEYHVSLWLIKTYAWKKIKCLELAILRPFLAFFANYIYIFHKTESQMINLRCLPNLNHNWLRAMISFSVKCVFQFCKKKRSFKNCHFWPFLVIFWLLHRYLSQNWDSDGHFEVLSVYKSYLDQKLQHNIG